MIPIKQKSISEYWNKFLLTSLTYIVCIILFIWAIPNTIALRNILLFSGSIIAVIIIFLNHFHWLQIQRKWYPILALALLYLWVVIHYLFFSLNRELEFSELKSIWIRALAGSLIALVLPIAFQEDRALRRCFFLFLFSTPIINIALYIYACFNLGGLITPQDYVVEFSFKKIETVFFGSLAAAIAAANLALLFPTHLQHQTPQKNLKIMFWIAGLFLCFLSAVLSNTKNGIIILLFIVFLLGLYLFLRVIKRGSNTKSTIALVIGLLLFSIAALRTHTHFSTGGWNSLIADIKIAVNIDDYLKWKVEQHDSPLPVNEYGSTVSGSTYMRVAWALVGVRLITSHPLGYGSINASYDGLLNLDGTDLGQHGQTHSGWVDFGLAYGVPGLILLLGTLILGVALSQSVNLLDRLQITFILITFIPLSLIAETTWKQYFEATLFFITYACALLVLKQDHPQN